jgi:hypothetical protein
VLVLVAGELVEHVNTHTHSRTCFRVQPDSDGEYVDSHTVVPTTSPQANRGSYTASGVYSPLSEEERKEQDEEVMESDKKVLEGVMARLDNVGALFKANTLGLFGVPRNQKAATAVRQEAAMLAMKLIGRFAGLSFHSFFFFIAHFSK